MRQRRRIRVETGLMLQRATTAPGAREQKRERHVTQGNLIIARYQALATISDPLSDECDKV